MTLNTIFTNHFHTYQDRFGPLPIDHLRVADAIMGCRTETLGGHRYQCPECSHQLTLYNSCGNRHCPQCQLMARGEWIDRRLAELLPVPYFHAVFTIPHQLNPFALRNKQVFYNLLFQSVKETLLELAQNNRRLGAHVGFITVLHTWGQNLMDHPHVHCIVPAGGLSHDGTRWKPCKGFFLFPFTVMKVLFRGKLLDYFKKAVASGEIALVGELEPYRDWHKLDALLCCLYKKEWSLFVKQPFAGPKSVIEYLGNYTHRTAISNHRIQSEGKDSVSFQYKDYADECRKKTMTVSPLEFIRRFMLHVIPYRFMRIRHYGFLANSCRGKRMTQLRMIFRGMKPVEKKKVPWYQRIMEKTGRDPRTCKVCGMAIMVAILEIPPVRKGWAT